MKTNKMKKVLIALDYDPTAQKVAEVGFSLAKTMKAEVTLLHVIADPVYYSLTTYLPIMGFSGNPGTVPIQFANIDGIKKTIQQFLDQAKHHLGDKTLQPLINEGDYAEAILKTAKDMQVEVIVMGSHSRRWLEEILMGSVTEKVLKQTSTPLFIVPTRKSSELAQDKKLEAPIAKDQVLINELLEKE
jgi:nucleotide-binding universal stress UspA family protein